MLAQEQMRGGLLGTGHSWVAMPSSRPDNGDAIAKSNTHLHDKPEETPLSLLDRTCARFYNACEDVCDSLVDPPIMPRMPWLQAQQPPLPLDWHGCSSVPTKPEVFLLFRHAVLVAEPVLIPLAQATCCLLPGTCDSMCCALTG